MGAPGYYVLCENGHIVGMIRDDIDWVEDTFKKLEELEKVKCPICGEIAKYRFCHYGDINDCISIKLVWNSKEKRWIIPSKLSDKQKEELRSCTIKKDVQEENKNG